MNQRLVYLVDDDQAVLSSLTFLLSSFGYAQRAWSNPLDFLADLPGLDPACVVTDLRMREMSGETLLAEMRRRSIDWPVLLMTSDSGPALREKARRQGFSACLPKPVQSDVLDLALKSAFADLENG